MAPIKEVIATLDTLLDDKSSPEMVEKVANLKADLTKVETENETLKGNYTKLQSLYSKAITQVGSEKKPEEGTALEQKPEVKTSFEDIVQEVIDKRKKS